MPDSKIPFHISIAMWIISLLVKLLNLTLRVSETKESREILSKKGASIMLIWHNRIAFTPYIKTRYRKRFPIYGLVSQSKDGAILSGFFKNFGIRTERGSSSKGGARASINLIRRLREGHDICITPDGPRGPKYRAKEGVSLIFEKTQARLLIIRADFEKSWTFKSWDEFKIPKPFSKIRISAEEILSLDELNAKMESDKTCFCDFISKSLSQPA